ncbi:PE-PPE domain-containing protein [Tsukamurella soli]|uniref:PE-PPE domain-containing protein n=1 Tax=Tsukamurella soli TaxID=644556 RepID=A0ABP8KER0_9ACTN
MDTTKALRATPRRVTVLAVGGTGESYDGDARTEVGGMLGYVTRELDDRFIARWVGYPASYGPVPARSGISYADSVALGVANLLAALDQADGPVVLIGYSQGAVVIRRVLGAIADGAVAHPGLLAVGLISDPHQPVGADPRCGGYGVAGPGPYVPESLPVLWVSHPEDVICNASGDSLVRDLADATASLSLATVGAWAPAALARYRVGLFQNAAKTVFARSQWLRDVRRLRTAATEILGYLPTLRFAGRVVNPRGSRHVAYAAEPLHRRRYEDDALTGCQVLAQWLQVQATFGTGLLSTRGAAAAQYRSAG